MARCTETIGLLALAAVFDLLWNIGQSINFITSNRHIATSSPTKTVRTRYGTVIIDNDSRNISVRYPQGMLDGKIDFI